MISAASNWYVYFCYIIDGYSIAYNPDQTHLLNMTDNTPYETDQINFWESLFYSTMTKLSDFLYTKSGVLKTHTRRPLPISSRRHQVTLLGNILLRSIVVSVLIRLINGYSVTDGTWLNLFLKMGGSVLLVDALHVVLGIAPSPCDDSPKGHLWNQNIQHTQYTTTNK